MSDEETQDLTQFQYDQNVTDCIATLELEAVDGEAFEIAGKCRSWLLAVFF